MFLKQLMMPRFSYFELFMIAFATQMFVNGAFLFAFGSIILGVLLEHILLWKLAQQDD